MPKKVIYLLFAAILISGCTLEQKLARSFVKLQPPAQFLLLEPDFLLKYNLKTFEIPGIDTLNDYLRDSILLENSLLLKEITDSILLKEFTDGFVKSLSSYGVSVLPQKAIDTLLENGGKPYIINIAQFTLEEFIHPYSSEEVVYDEVLIIDGFDVNAISFNAWIELSRLNSENKNKVLFVSDFMTDDVDGVLRRNLLTGKVIFDFTLDTITAQAAYKFSGRFGKMAAIYLYDYVLNAYIRENLPESYPYEPYYYHYNPQKKLLYSIDKDQRILELESDR
jgi:hypothetical protein